MIRAKILTETRFINIISVERINIRICCCYHVNLYFTEIQLGFFFLSVTSPIVNY